MSTVKGLHTSDNHLGFRQYGLKIREQDIQNAFQRVVELAIRERYDYITVSGDLLNVKQPSVDTMKFLANINARLMEAGIPMLVISGNHDGGMSSANWASIFDSAEDGEDLLRKGGIYDIDYKRVWLDGITIYGCPYVSKSKWLEIQKDLPNTDILLMHQTFEEFFQFPTVNSFSAINDLEAKYHLVIVGDIHVSEVKDVCLSTDRVDFRLLSPGSTELMSKGEEDIKYVWESEFGLNGINTLRQLRIPTRPVLHMEVTTYDEFKQLIANSAEYTEDYRPILYLTINIPNMASAKALPNMDVLASNSIFRPTFHSGVFDTSKVEYEGATAEEEEITLEMIAKDFVTNSSQFVSPDEKIAFLATVLSGISKVGNFKKELAGYIDNYLQ